jgi:hypothetical protein
MTDNRHDNRQKLTLLDGTAIFRSPEDDANENALMAEVAELWGPDLQIERFGLLSPIDFFGRRHERVTGLLEGKCRTHTIDTYPTVFLNVRKYLALMMGSIGMNVPGIFIVKFACGTLRWISVTDVDARKMRMGGWNNKKKRNDYEPVIEVDVVSMHALERSDR